MIDIFIGCMSASTDKPRPRSLRSGLSALGSGGRLVGTLKKAHIFALRTLKNKIKLVWYEGIQVILVRGQCVPDLLGGSSVGWLKSS